MGGPPSGEKTTSASVQLGDTAGTAVLLGKIEEELATKVAMLQVMVKGFTDQQSADQPAQRAYQKEAGEKAYLELYRRCVRFVDLSGAVCYRRVPSVLLDLRRG